MELTLVQIWQIVYEMLADWPTSVTWLHYVQTCGIMLVVAVESDQ